MHPRHPVHGIPLNELLGTRTAMQRIAIAVVSVPPTVMFAVALFTFNALLPETIRNSQIRRRVLAGIIECACFFGDSALGARKLTNVVRQGFSGHHYVIMALCSALAAFLVNALFASAAKPLQKTSAGTIMSAAE